jgi:hypothetical protein
MKGRHHDGKILKVAWLETIATGSGIKYKGGADSHTSEFESGISEATRIGPACAPCGQVPLSVNNSIIYVGGP